VERLLSDSEVRATMLHDYARLRQQLCRPKPLEGIARAVQQLLLR
jgi:hypothetical protein